MNDPKDWKYESSETSGFHTIISPENSICKLISIFRLNLKPQQPFPLKNDQLELNGVVIEGSVKINSEGRSLVLDKYDSFYLPGGMELLIEAAGAAVIFIGGAPFESRGEFFCRKYDPDCEDKNIRQVHGRQPYRRDVFMTLSQFDNASRLICGITTGDQGMWTSWPPHQHTRDLEEVYCYFDLPKPKFALHLCSRYEGIVEFVHPVSTGSCVIIPEGYHPTVAMPGVKSCYFWVMAAHSAQSRRYDLAINDPSFL